MYGNNTKNKRKKNFRKSSTFLTLAMNSSTTKSTNPGEKLRMEVPGVEEGGPEHPTCSPTVAPKSPRTWGRRAEGERGSGSDPHDLYAPVVPGPPCRAGVGGATGWAPPAAAPVEVCGQRHYGAVR